MLNGGMVILVFGWAVFKENVARLWHGVVKSLERIGMYNTLLLYSNHAYGCTVTINRYVTVYHTCVYILQPPPDQRS